MTSLTDPSATGRRKLLLVGHDAHRHGAQMLLLNLGRVCREQFGYEIRFLLLGGGELLDDYRRVGRLGVVRSAPQLAAAARWFADEGHAWAIANTVASGAAVEALSEVGIRVVSLVHELPGLIGELKLEHGAERVRQSAEAVVFPSEYVRSVFEETFGPVAGAALTRPQGIYQALGRSGPASLRAELGLSPGARIVLGIGHGDLRKGVDLFCATAQLVGRTSGDAHFVWVGALSPEAARWFAGAAKPANVHFIGHREDVGALIAAADLFLLTSREDPFPSVVLEAVSGGLRAVGFDGAGGFVDVLADERFGALAPLGDVVAMADLVTRELRAPPAPGARAQAQAEIRRRFAFDAYALDLLRLTDPDLREGVTRSPRQETARQGGRSATAHA